MKTITFTQINVAKRKNIFILLTLLFPLFSSANAQTPKEIMQSIYDLYVSEKYKEAVILDVQHSIGDYTNVDFEEAGRNYKMAYEKVGGIKEYKIISEDYENSNKATVKVHVFYRNGTTVESIVYFIKDGSKWKADSKKSTSKLIDAKDSQISTSKSLAKNVKQISNSISLESLGKNMFMIGFAMIISGSNILLGLLIWLILIAIPCAVFFLMPVFSRIDAKHSIKKDKRMFYMPIISAALGALSFFIGNGAASFMYMILLVGVFFIYKNSVSTKGTFIRIANLCLFSFYCYFAGAMSMILILIAIAVAFSKGLFSFSGKEEEKEEDLFHGMHCRDCMYYPGGGYNCNYNGKSSKIVHDNTVACRSYRH